jgi:hypothetical protein
MDGGIPGESLPAPAQYVEADSVPTRHCAVDSDGLPFSTPTITEDSGLLESKGTDLESRGEEESLLRDARVL